MPVARVLAHAAWLAFERARRARSRSHKLESGRIQDVSLAPFYLIWENLADAQVRPEGDYGWPYQLVGVELIRSRDRFPQHGAARERAGPRCSDGFSAFRIHCSRCHTVNGEGGTDRPGAQPRREPGRPARRRLAARLDRRPEPDRARHAHGAAEPVDFPIATP